MLGRRREGSGEPGGGLNVGDAGWMGGQGKDDQAGFSGPGQLGGWRGLVHIKGVVTLAAGMAPPFPAQWGFAL